MFIKESKIQGFVIILQIIVGIVLLSRRKTLDIPLYYGLIVLGVAAVVTISTFIKNQKIRIFIMFLSGFIVVASIETGMSRLGYMYGIFMLGAFIAALYNRFRVNVMYLICSVMYYIVGFYFVRDIQFQEESRIFIFVFNLAILILAQIVILIFQNRVALSEQRYRLKEQSVEDLLNVVEAKKRSAQQASKAKADFLANMSHEIRTPMNAIVGMAQLASEEEMSEEAVEYLRQIQSEGKSLVTIINDILDFSKIESGKMKIVEAEYVPVTLFYDVMNIAQVRTEGKPIQLLIDMPPDIPRKLMGDNNRIRQVVLNLLNNAVKFTQSGSVTLRLSYKPTYSPENTIIGIDMTIEVEDTGIGIRPQDIKKIFKDFEQIDTKRNRAVEGTGLGLAISKQLVYLMNGKLEVDSKYGCGSRFYFTIYQEVVDAAPSIVCDEEYHPGPQPLVVANILLGGNATQLQENIFDCVGKRRFHVLAPNAKVLIVDDNEINLKVAKGLMRTYAINADVATKARTALAMLECTQYDIIFMDHMMPEIDGIQATRLIRELGVELPYLKTIPMIALTANALSDARELFLKSGMNDFIGKPIEIEELERVLEQWIPTDHVLARVPFGYKAMQKAMKLMGDEALYYDIVEQYCNQVSEKTKYIKQLFCEGKWKEYMIEVHSLKSLSRTIGDEELGEMAYQLEKAGNTENLAFLQEKTPIVLCEYQRYHKEPRKE